MFTSAFSSFFYIKNNLHTSKHGFKSYHPPHLLVHKFGNGNVSVKGVHYIRHLFRALNGGISSVLGERRRGCNYSICGGLGEVFPSFPVSWRFFFMQIFQNWLINFLVCVEHACANCWLKCREANMSANGWTIGRNKCSWGSISEKPPYNI